MGIRSISKGIMDLEAMIKSFVRRYGDSEFPHSKKVIGLLKNSEGLVFTVRVVTARLNDEMRSNYRFRAEMASRNVSDLAPNLAEDAMALARAVEDADDQPIRSWWVPVETGRGYLVFELLTDERIAGCLETIDAREMPGA